MARDDRRLMEYAKKAAIGAGALIMEYFRKREYLVKQVKSDQTPVTEADFAAQQYIEQVLKTQNRRIPLLSEEHIIPDYDTRSQWQRYWLIDPLDGTKRFIKGFGDFAVCIALIEDHYPTVGVIYHPFSKTLYYACQDSAAFLLKGRTKRRLATRHHNQHYVVFCSPDHGVSGHAQQRLPIGVQYKPVGSALKFCYIAQGLGDIYPGFGLTSEWDVAAGQCILEQAGGLVVDDKGRRFSYNTKPRLETKRFWGIGNPEYTHKLIRSH